MVCRVLKNTRGYAGKEVAMRLRENTYIIEQAPPVTQEESVPADIL